MSSRALFDTAAGRARTVIVNGPAGVGKSSLLTAMTARANELGFRVGHGTSASVEGAWPYAPVVEALADVCRRHPTLLDGLPDHHRTEIDRALAGPETSWTGGSSHQRLFVAAAELVRLASATNGLLLTIDDVHDADDASLRLVHYIARSTREERVCIVLTHRPAPMTETLQETLRSLIDRNEATVVELGPLDHDDIETLTRRHIAEPTAELIEQIEAFSRGIPFAVNELARRAANEPRWVQALDANMIGGIAPATREILQRVAVVGSTFDTDEFVALSGLPETAAFDHLDRALAALGRRAREHRLPIPPWPGTRRAPRRPPTPPPSPDPSRRRQSPHRATRLGGADRSPSPSVRCGYRGRTVPPTSR